MFSTMEFKYVSTLRKKLFSVAAVKFFLGLNLDSLVFGNASLGEINGHSVTTKHLQN